MIRQTGCAACMPLLIAFLVWVAAVQCTAASRFVVCGGRNQQRSICELLPHSFVVVHVRYTVHEDCPACEEQLLTSPALSSLQMSPAGT